jgi:hypothetical protein
MDWGRRDEGDGRAECIERRRGKIKGATAKAEWIRRMLGCPAGVRRSNQSSLYGRKTACHSPGELWTLRVDYERPRTNQLLTLVPLRRDFRTTWTTTPPRKIRPRISINSI